MGWRPSDDDLVDLRARQYFWEAFALVAELNNLGTGRLSRVHPDYKRKPPGCSPVSFKSDPASPLNEFCLDSFAGFREREEAICEAVVDAAYRYYVHASAYFRRVDGEDEEVWPHIHAPEEIRRMIGFTQLHVFPAQADGSADIGFEFACSWDEEHGFGARVWGGRVVRAGQADEAFQDRENVQHSIDHFGDGMQPWRR